MSQLPKYMKNLTNIKRVTNKQYEWLYTHRCQHRHRYSTHFNCFLKEHGIKERVGFLDIETSNLKANFGIVLCWCILDQEGNLYYDYLTAADVKKGTEDKRIVQTCINTMNQFDRVVGHFSTYFDIPFLRTRAIMHGLEFPTKLYHTDVWRMCKRKLCLHSNRQDVMAESLFGKTVKTRIDHSAWRKATGGHKESVAEVLDHCVKDVDDLKRNFNALLPYCRLVKSPIL